MYPRMGIATSIDEEPFWNRLIISSTDEACSMISRANSGPALQVADGVPGMADDQKREASLVIADDRVHAHPMILRFSRDECIVGRPPVSSDVEG